MRSLYSILMSAGTVYGWRIDAIAISGLLWMLALGYTRVRLAIA
ncbi:MAG TPA: hypothetical protein VM674_05135 [Candidatus Acidoferrum sp.]|nr:hypothetical protein [Candidatus Acidoferrum sp.]